MGSRFILPYADIGNGISPSDGAQLFFYETGTSTPKDTYSDSAATTPNANPVIADSTGVFPNIFIAGTYKVVLKDKNDVQIWEADPVDEFAKAISTETVKNFATLALAVANAGLVDGNAVTIAERTTGNGGGGMWDAVLSTTVTENALDIVQCVGSPLISIVQRELARPYGVSDTAVLIATDLIPGQKAETISYYEGWAATAVPKGGATYSISTLQEVRDAKGSAGWVPDEIGEFTLNNSYIATLSIDSLLNVSVYGATGAGLVDDTARIQSALDTGYSIELNKGERYLIDGTLQIFNSTSKYGQSIHGNNGRLVQNKDSGFQECLHVEGFRNNLYDIEFESSDLLNVAGVGLFLFNRQCNVSGLRFYGGWGVCMDLSQTKEGSIENIHIENRALNALVPLGIGIAIASCLNIQISNSYIGWCDTNIGPGADVGAGHGNEGILISDNTVIKAGNEQINIQGLHIDIHNNVIDLCGGDTGSAILLKGQSIKLTENWIADNSQDSSTKTLVHFYDGSYQATVKGNTFWRGLQEGGIETLISLDMGGTCQFSEISGNLFAGRMAGTPIQSAGNIVLSSNLYDDGATPLTITGTRSGVTRLDPQTTAYLPSLRLGDDSASLFLARLGSLGASGLYAAHFTNNLGDTAFRTGDGDGTLALGFNAAKAANYMGADSVTSRSLNAAGTLNASGADYAEYMTKSPSCNDIAKGDICGIDTNGQLTSVFSDSISFVVKSTSPCVVGGDAWGVAAIENESRESFLSRQEEARQSVDRIAFCGQVPVNVIANAGDYIIPSNDAGAITGQAVASPTFEQYQQAIGKVISVIEGVTTVIIKII